MTRKVPVDVPDLLDTDRAASGERTGRVHANVGAAPTELLAKRKPSFGVPFDTFWNRKAVGHDRIFDIGWLGFTLGTFPRANQWDGSQNRTTVLWSPEINSQGMGNE